MGAREWFEQVGQRIIDYYTGLEDGIFKLIIDLLAANDYQSVEAADVLAWQFKMLSKGKNLTLKTRALIKARGALNKTMVKQLVKDYGQMTTAEVDKELQGFTNQTVSVSDETKQIIEGMATQTWQSLNNNVNESLVTNNYGDSAVTKAYRQILKESTMASVTGQMTHEQAINQALAKVVDRGLPTRLTDKQGHTWSIEGYVRTVVTTTANRTYNSVRMQRMKDFHTTLAVMSAHPNSRPACAYIQGKVVNIVPQGHPDYDDRYDTIYNHGYGTPGGTLGINCRHTLTPFNPATMKNHQPQYDPQKAIENGKLVQQQRARERAIRDAKKRLKVAEALDDPVMISRNKTLLAARQKKLREFIKDTNEGKSIPVLTRDYNREKVATKEVDFKEQQKLQKRAVMNVEKQNKHVRGTKEFNSYQQKLAKRGYSQSYITVDPSKLDDLVREHINPAKLTRQFQYVDFGEVIGHYVTKGVDLETARGKVMQSKTGYHVVPAKPKEMLRDESKRKKQPL